MAIVDRRGDNRRGRFGSASEKSYYEMKKAAEERANRKKATAKPKSKSNAELKQIADRDNRRGLTKEQARDIDLTGTRKRGSGAKDKTTTPKTTTPKTTTPNRQAGVGTIDGPRKTTTQNTSILKQPERVSTNSEKTSSFKEKVIQKANALKQRVIDKGKALNKITGDGNMIKAGGARPFSRKGVSNLFSDGPDPSRKKDSPKRELTDKEIRNFNARNTNQIGSGTKETRDGLEFTTTFGDKEATKRRKYFEQSAADLMNKGGAVKKGYRRGGSVSKGNGCAVRGIK
jgi:hypothetical protein